MFVFWPVPSTRQGRGSSVFYSAYGDEPGVDAKGGRQRKPLTCRHQRNALGGLVGDLYEWVATAIERGQVPQAFVGRAPTHSSKRFTRTRTATGVRVAC